MWRGISLANKCLLLFGGAVVLIVLAALSVPWFRMNALVDDGQMEVSRQLVSVWERLDAEARGRGVPVPAADGAGNIVYAGIAARRLSPEQVQAEAQGNPFVRRALREFARTPDRLEYQASSWDGLMRQYRYARALRPPDAPDQLAGVVLLERRPFAAARLIVVNIMYLLSAGLVVLGLAVLVVYFITHELILAPVHALKATAERVRDGDLATRSEITTGDEFEELSRTFNAMLAELQRGQDQLHAVNRALDVKLNELAEANTALYQSAKLKGEFLANVSHELRTPLNSIIGFAELLLEIAHAEAGAGDDSSRLAKRIRYVENITTASRGLLDMINSLLEMAKLEAGRVEVNPEGVNLSEASDGLLGLIAPLAQRKGLELSLEAAPDLPIIQTDPKKLQQIVFNFLSNAVKFTPAIDRDGRPGRITLRTERLPGRGVSDADASDRVRISVIDTGPGIAPDQQRKLFQKFQQLDGSHTREHTGTGLGLAISKELAAILQGEIQLVSEPGRGSMFSLILPLKLDPERATEIRLENAFRGALAGRRELV